ncbi:hypothetical protein [Lolliginicoccus levis]|uniref:hypothetical protein n=1 Tax=Lolliginicoccus levis TaxID=2919542 RepID=UPI00241D96C4|nr:hypothetical protein [Lolliginicoccus levis]
MDPRMMLGLAVVMVLAVVAMVLLAVVALGGGDEGTDASGPVASEDTDAGSGPAGGEAGLAERLAGMELDHEDQTIGLSPLTGLPPMSPADAVGQGFAVGELREPGVDAQDPAQPGGLIWKQFGTFVLPVSPGAGPARIDGHCASGFARTAQGAITAAAHLNWRAAMFPEQCGDAVAALGEPGEFELDRAAMIQTILRGPDGQGTPLPQIVYPFRAVRVVEFSPDHAVVETALSTNDARFELSRFELDWVDGDWQLRDFNGLVGGAPAAALEGDWTWW